MILARKARTLMALPLAVIAWLPAAWLALGVSRAAVLCVEFRKLAPWLGIVAGSAPFSVIISPLAEARARQVEQIIRIAAHYTPWQSNCFAQAIVARLLLSHYRIPYLIFFGVRTAPMAAAMAESTLAAPGMEAHAWVTAGRVMVAGGASFQQFGVAGIFRAAFLAPHTGA